MIFVVATEAMTRMMPMIVFVMTTTAQYTIPVMNSSSTTTGPPPAVTMTTMTTTKITATTKTVTIMTTVTATIRRSISPEIHGLTCHSNITCNRKGFCRAIYWVLAACKLSLNEIPPDQGTFSLPWLLIIRLTEISREISTQQVPALAVEVEVKDGHEGGGGNALLQELLHFSFQVFLK